MRRDKRVCLGAFAGAQGVKGETRVKSFTASEDGVARYGPVETEDGARRFKLEFIRILRPGVALVRAPEIKSREDAASLAGVRFYAPRSALPEPDADEFYVEDLIGLSAKDEQNAVLGVVSAVYNFGGGDLVEIKDARGGLTLVPFTAYAVPSIDLAGGALTVAVAHQSDGENAGGRLEDGA